MADKKVVKLSCHKNTKQQRDSKMTRKTMKECTSYCSNLEDVQGFCMVSWDSKGSYKFDMYDPKCVIGLNTLPSWLSGAATRYVGDKDR